MGSWLDFYDDPFLRFNGHPFGLNPFQKSPPVRIYDWLYDRAHGGDKYAISQVPLLGWWRRVRDSSREAQDYYDNTGEDPLYMSRYGGNAGSVSGIAGPLSRVPRMARSLSALYPAEIKENLNLRIQSYRESQRAALYWNEAWKTRYGRD